MALFLCWGTASGPNAQTLVRLERIVFLISGSYVARLIGQQRSNDLQERVLTETRRADALTVMKEQALQTNELLAEKIRSGRAGLTVDITNNRFESESLRHVIAVARRIVIM
jgi:hypothetical protein